MNTYTYCFLFCLPLSCSSLPSDTSLSSDCYQDTVHCSRPFVYTQTSLQDCTRFAKCGLNGQPTYMQCKRFYVYDFCEQKCVAVPESCRSDVRQQCFCAAERSGREGCIVKVAREDNLPQEESDLSIALSLFSDDAGFLDVVEKLLDGNGETFDDNGKLETDDSSKQNASTWLTSSKMEDVIARMFEPLFPYFISQGGSDVDDNAAVASRCLPPLESVRKGAESANAFFSFPLPPIDGWT